MQTLFGRNSSRYEQTTGISWTDTGNIAMETQLEVIFVNVYMFFFY